MSSLIGSGSDITLSLYQGSTSASDAARTLKHSASNSPEAAGDITADDIEAREAANKFEALLIHNMLKSMRKTTMSEDTSNARAIYDDMLDKELADTMIESGGIGIADQIFAQIKQQRGTDTGTDSGTDSGTEQNLSDAQRLRELAAHIPNPVDATVAGSTSVPMQPAGTLTVTDDGTTYMRSAKADTASTDIGQLRLAATLWSGEQIEKLSQLQHDFVQPLIPHARLSAQKLGTSPAAILAVAALETGWGSAMITDKNGADSHNLFGIKATGSDNSYATTITTEYIDGSPQKLQAKFKTYTSDADAVNGFADFILKNPRYSNALQHAGDPERFLYELQDAGYATDPRYAQKAISIMRQIARNPMPL